MTLPWLCSWREAVDDPKLRALSHGEFRVWWTMLHTTNDQGEVQIVPGMTLVESVATRMASQHEPDAIGTTSTAIHRLAKIGLVRVKGERAWFPAFERRQGRAMGRQPEEASPPEDGQPRHRKPSDSPERIKARVNKSRGRSSGEGGNAPSSPPVTPPCNAPVTPPGKGCNAPCNAPVTPPSTYSERSPFQTFSQGNREQRGEGSVDVTPPCNAPVTPPHSLLVTPPGGDGLELVSTLGADEVMALMDSASGHALIGFGVGPAELAVYRVLCRRGLTIARVAEFCEVIRTRPRAIWPDDRAAAAWRRDDGVTIRWLAGWQERGEYDCRNLVSGLDRLAKLGDEQEHTSRPLSGVEPEPEPEAVSPEQALAKAREGRERLLAQGRIARA